jgi:maltose O-acetyltransferase
MERPGIMRTEKEKMLAGDPYDPGDDELRKERLVAQRFMAEYNRTTVEDRPLRNRLLQQRLGSLGERVTLRAPLFVDYGYNIFIGDNVFMNFGCVFLDVCKISIGADTQVGPGVQFYTADHPQDPEQRRSGIEFGKQITVGSNVWIGGHAIILPGITIGDNAIVGAGSVVTRNVAAGTKVAGNPARVIG